jgi:hypothetical protein
MVESPTASLNVSEKSLNEKDDVNSPLLASDIESVTVQEPVTSKIRTTMHHIRSLGGFTARWRGLPAFLAWAVMTAFMRRNIMALFAGGETSVADIGLPAAHVLGSVWGAWTMAWIHMMWTHRVISMPGAPYFNFTGGGANARKVWAAAIMNSLAWEATIGIPMALAYYSGAVVFEKTDGMTHIQVGSSSQEFDISMVMKMLSIAAIGVTTFFGLYIPSYVALIRVEASVLPANIESIVRIDRTFGGRVTVDSEGCTNGLGFVAAWSSFTASQRKKLLSMIGRIFAVEVVLHMIVGFFFATVALAFLHPEVFANTGKFGRMTPTI